MSSLQDQIDADAGARLQLPPGARAVDELERYQKFLRLELQRVRGRHRDGAPGREVVAARTRVFDQLLTALLRTVVPSPAGSGAAEAPALVAMGGYGRAELSPYSDLSVLFLPGEEAGSTATAARVHGLFEDPAIATLLPQHKFRTGVEEEFLAAAQTDLWTKTALLEARLITGGNRTFTRFQKAFQARCVRRQERAFIEARQVDQAARRARFGDAVCLQEPHVLNGCGGLRDLQSLLWMAGFKYRGRTLAELEAAELISAHERAQLDAAYDFLLRVRDEAHHVAERSADQLTKSIQPAVAHGFGYTERSLSERIERFMRAYYMQARTIHLITRTLEERLALLPEPRQLPSLKHILRERRKRAMYVIDGFKFVDGQIHAANRTVFRSDPTRLIRVFRHAQQRGLTLDPGLTQLVREEVGRLGRGFCTDPSVHETFLEILNQRGNVAPTLRAMHEVGVLGAYLPPFGKLTCLVQHEFFHQYTADEHTLMCIARLDEMAGAKEGVLTPYADIFHKEIDRPYLLYLALLLHDAGKARPTQDHADDGSKIAAAVGRRLGLEPGTIDTLRFVVRHHLAMVIVSQRRDLDEPAEIRRFAALVGSVDRLDLLTLHTVADSLGTSDKLWNGFKNTLLLTLYRRTRELLQGGPEFIEAASRRRDHLAEGVQSVLPSGFPADEVEAHFAAMPSRYFLLREARDIGADLATIHHFLARVASDDADPLDPVATWEDAPERGYTVVRVATWDRVGLFSRICGALTATGLNILSAEIFTRADLIAIDAFQVIDAASGALVDERAQLRFLECLRETVCDGADPRESIGRRRPPEPIYDAASLPPIPTIVRFDNLASEERTLLEIEAPDRVGLLFAMTQVLSELGLDISVAKICTERGAAFDSFYIVETNGTKIESEGRQEEISRRLREAMDGLA